MQKKSKKLKKTKKTEKTQRKEVFFKALSKIKFKYTLLFVLLIVLFYLAFSTFLLYIPNKTLLQFGFSLRNPVGILSYAFVHNSPIHIISNVLLLAGIGFIAEQKLRGKDYIAIFFLSAAVSGLAFTLLEPNTFLVGASAGISGLIVAACLVNIKRTIIYFIAFSVAITLLSPAIHSATADLYNQLLGKSQDLEQQFNNTQIEIEQAISRNDTELTEQLQQQQQQIFQELNETVYLTSNVEQGIERERRAETSTIVHLLGAGIAFIYLALFRRDIIWESPSAVFSRKI